MHSRIENQLDATHRNLILPGKRDPGWQSLGWIGHPAVGSAGEAIWRGSDWRLAGIAIRASKRARPPVNDSVRRTVGQFAGGLDRRYSSEISWVLVLAA